MCQYYTIMFMRNTTSDVNKKICLKIKLERIKRGWSQEQLAEYSKLSVNTIGRIERSQISPTIDTIVQIANSFELDFNTLTDLSNI